MSDTNPNQSLEEALASVSKLEKALEAERAAHKSAKDSSRQFRARIAQGFGLGEDADADAITARLADSETIISERTASIAKERDEALRRAADIESRWKGEKVDSALRSAFEKSGAKAEHLEDFLLLARGLFEVGEDGAVRTRKDAPDTLPGIDPSAWIHSELKAKRAHYFPLSSGGGAKGVPGLGAVGGPSIDCFKPGSHNLTQQFALVSAHGASAVRTALQRAGLAVPGWMR